MKSALGQQCTRCTNKTARAIAFAVWAVEQEGVPSTPAIVARFNADRDTAARWRRWFAGVTGRTLPPPRRGRPRR